MKMDFVNQILMNYDIGTYTTEKVPVNMNSAWKIVSNNGIYLLKTYNQDYDASLFGANAYSNEALKYEMEYLRFLQENGLPVQKPVRNKAQEYVTKYEDTLSILTEWIDGEEAEVKELTLADYSAIGKLLAKIHKASMHYTNIAKRCPRLPFDEERIDFFLDRISLGCKNGFFDENIFHIAVDAGDKINHIMKEMSMKENAKGLIHGDFYSYNLVKNNLQFAPIDFELCSYGYYYQDLAAICNENPDDGLIFGFLQAYQNELGIVVNPDYLKAMQAYLTLFYLAANYDKKEDYSWVDILL